MHSDAEKIKCHPSHWQRVCKSNGQPFTSLLFLQYTGHVIPLPEEVYLKQQYRNHCVCDSSCIHTCIEWFVRCGH